MTQTELIVTDQFANLRLDVFLSEQLEISRTMATRLINDGHVLLNTKYKKAGTKLQIGDKVIATVHQEPLSIDITPQNIPLNIIYEDTDIIIVNKEKGIVVHPAPGHSDNTLVNALLYHCQNLSGINNKKRPGIVHRLDKDTSGILIVCKNDKSHLAIADALAKRQVLRVYTALILGNLKDDTKTINAPIGRHPIDRKKMCVIYKNSREAITHITKKQQLKNHTLIEARLETGRTHQIRVHMAHIGHHILGDNVYGRKNTNYLHLGQLLHASKVAFVHPTTNEYVEFEAPLPEFFQDIIEKLTI